MNVFTKESLEQLRERIDLYEVLSSFITLTKSGAFYKAHCPFHEEKTPSFMVQRQDSHYHCYGCGAHGDAISFLMQNQKMSFSESVEYLAEKFHIHLDKTDQQSNQPSISKPYLKQVLLEACHFYHFYLLHTQEGQIALTYLFNRGVDLDFIKNYRIGFSPARATIFLKMMQSKGIKNKDLHQVGLLRTNEKDFFTDRIMIPIQDALGAVIGFTARKYREETFGPKYINTPETPLFKKSKILFGLSYCRKRIMKERRVLIVEGQLDALSLIHNGFDWVVASQGTAFTKEHVREIVLLEVNQVYLALDSDRAGQEAAIKIGHLFQKEAIEVFIAFLPANSDPDDVLKEQGPREMEKILLASQDYLSFLVSIMSKRIDINSPSGKNEIIQKISGRIREWEHPLMVHESLRKLARLTQTPESVIGVGKEDIPNVYIKKSASITYKDVDPDRVLETDLLRWLFLVGTQEEKIVVIAKNNLRSEHFHVATCQRLYKQYMHAYENNESRDLLSFAINLNDAEEQLFLSEMLQKKVNRDKALESFIEGIQKVLDRHWLLQREHIRMKIHSGKCSDEEALGLAKQFDEIKRQRPQVDLPASK